METEREVKKAYIIWHGCGKHRARTGVEIVQHLGINAKEYRELLAEIKAVDIAWPKKSGYPAPDDLHEVREPAPIVSADDIVSMIRKNIPSTEIARQLGCHINRVAAIRRQVSPRGPTYTQRAREIMKDGQRHVAGEVAEQLGVPVDKARYVLAGLWKQGEVTKERGKDGFVLWQIV